MSIEGRIAIDVSFADTATSSGVQSLKKITLVDTTAYTTGKVAILTGTCGTATVSISVAPSTYRDASGSLVSFATVSRIAFAADNRCECQPTGEDELISSSGNRVALTDVLDVVDFQVSRTGTSGTASYTLVLYGT
jgi:hypothetical protein